jgi:hypothetical protein
VHSPSSSYAQLWYRLFVDTVGLIATSNLGQPFNFEGSCRCCGAGAVPVPPLFIDANRMGKKSLDATAHDGRLVVTRALAEGLKALRLTGLRSFPVAHKTQTTLRLIDAYEWLEPTFEWPPLAEDSIVARQDQCGECGRSGHYDSMTPPTSLHYRLVPDAATDLGATFEYFGRWRAPGASAPHVGGGRLLIVSERFKSALAAAKVRHVTFEPIRIGP